ncbi:pyridoxamine 5'-phosphate oxidase family protein [Mycobacteroides abscessus]|uniref:pyridoxamine 5'-phosphate oxidase family protein n=1 Tax=Mycobacteroides abscessus TaxID=36809 RepID=UPI002670B8D3|nr:pyridoxamine 5'-phosphate oxidase family protein [Mycobacteroides abscessus]MDO3108075.1 pyridoxamine 5'-phosphate oxidase family protein [Mycobacteroides abscessus subsp. abscessus]
MTVSTTNTDDQLRDSPDLLVHRYKWLQRRERADLFAILDAGTIAHVGFVRPDGKPMVIPMAYARDGEFLLMHGSSGSGLTRSAVAGVELVATISIFDGLVYAQSLFDSTVNYRCAMVFGRAVPVTEREREDCIRVISERLMPGRWTEVRPPTKRELAATYILRMPLDMSSVKVREGQPTEDARSGIWTGYLPFESVVGEPVPQLGVDIVPAQSITMAADVWKQRLRRPTSAE